MKTSERVPNGIPMPINPTLIAPSITIILVALRILNVIHWNWIIVFIPMLLSIAFHGYSFFIMYKILRESELDDK